MSKKINTEELRIDRFDSSGIKAAMYNHTTGDLTIRFPSGALYTYKNVDPDTYMQMVYSPSIGKAFNELIKNDHKVEQSEDLYIIPG